MLSDGRVGKLTERKALGRSGVTVCYQVEGTQLPKGLKQLTHLQPQRHISDDMSRGRAAVKCSGNGRDWLGGDTDKANQASTFQTQGPGSMGQEDHECMRVWGGGGLRGTHRDSQRQPGCPV